MRTPRLESPMDESPHLQDILKTSAATRIWYMLRLVTITKTKDARQMSPVSFVKAVLTVSECPVIVESVSHFGVDSRHRLHV